MKVLITDGEQRSALAAVRALGESQVEVYVGETTETCLASKSKYCRGAVTYPSPYVDEAGFIRALGRAVSRLGVDLIMPMTDVTSAVLSDRGAGLALTTCIGVVDSDRFWRASDKNALHRLADRAHYPDAHHALHLQSSRDRDRARRAVSVHRETGPFASSYRNRMDQDRRHAGRLPAGARAPVSRSTRTGPPVHAAAADRG